MTGFSQRAILKITGAGSHDPSAPVSAFHLLPNDILRKTGNGSHVPSVPVPAFHFLLILLLMLTACASVARAQIRYDNYIYEDESFLDRLDDVRVEKTSPFQDVPPDHWAYKAVQRLVDSGLLAGYDDTMYRGDQVVTRYELAMIVAKLLDNYLEWYRTGHVSASEYPTSGYTTPKSMGGAPLRAIEPPEAVISPTARVAVELPSLRSRGISRTTPRIMGEETVGTQVSLVFSDENIAQIKGIAKDAFKEEFDFNQKDFDDLSKLVNEFKKELKDMNKKFDKDLKGLQKDVQKNARAIKNLEEENRRITFTGTERFFWFTKGVLTGDGCYDPKDDPRCNIREADLFNSITLDFISRPDPNVDLTIGGTMMASMRIGGQRAYKDDRKNEPAADDVTEDQYHYWNQQFQASYRRYIEGNSTAFTLRNLYLNYNNSNVDPKNPKNFKLRSLQIGDITPSFSLLTVFGKKREGLSATFQLNDYTFTTFGSRDKLHQREPTFIPDSDDSDVAWDFNTTFFNQDQYDHYKYGFTLETSLFGNPLSRFNISRVYSYDDKDTNYPGCENGKWIDLSFAYDQYSFKKPDTDFSTTDMFCLPPEKNSVSSLFLIHPLTESITLYGEYAHSDYYREPYKILKPFDTFTSCNTKDAGNEFVCWWEGREENYQDDAFAFIISYSKGPISLFPTGYLRLGPHFTTDLDLSAFGGGDFDISSSLAILPIKIQSMSGYIGTVTYTPSTKDTAKVMIFDAQEIEPMYFDPGALAVGFSSNSSKGTSMPILSTALSRLNNRESKLKLKYWQANYDHYISDKVKFYYQYKNIGALLPISCLDGNITIVTDEFGNTIDKTAGNGVTDCTREADTGDINFGLKYWSTTQTYGFNWMTSKNSNLDFEYDIYNSDLTMIFTPAVEDVILNLAPRGRYNQVLANYRYRLSKATNITLMYGKKYDLYPDGSDVDGEKYPVRDFDAFMFKVESSF